jgi:transposase
MQKRDGRSIPDAALEVLRERAVAMHEAGNTQRAIAAALGVHKNTVHQWLKGWRVVGAAALKAKKRGRRHEAQRLLDATQAAEVQQLMTESCPDQLDLPYALWGREAVRDLARARFGVRLALRTVSDYLRRLSTSSTSRRGIGPEGPMGFTPQRPLARAKERQPAAIATWLATTYPAIAKRARTARAVIYWGDETGISNQDQIGRSYAPIGLRPIPRRDVGEADRGQTPVIARTAKRISRSMISAVSNRGLMRFMLYKGALNAAGFIAFLRRLIKDAGQKVILIVDNLQVHKAGKVQAWVASHAHAIELRYLPSYAPDHNPSEYLNNDLKQQLRQQRQPGSEEELIERTRSVLRAIQRSPERIQGYFRPEPVRYAA